MHNMMYFDLFLKTDLTHTHKHPQTYVFDYKCIEKVWKYTYQTVKKQILLGLPWWCSG